jgi:hypothetical protein
VSDLGDLSQAWIDAERELPHGWKLMSIVRDPDEAFRDMRTAVDS